MSAMNNAKGNEMQKAMSEVLAALGFEAMARDVLSETENERLARYARVCIRNSREPQRSQLVRLFRAAKLA